MPGRTKPRKAIRFAPTTHCDVAAPRTGARIFESRARETGPPQALMGRGASKSGQAYPIIRRKSLTLSKRMNALVLFSRPIVEEDSDE